MPAKAFFMLRSPEGASRSTHASAAAKTRMRHHRPIPQRCPDFCPSYVPIVITGLAPVIQSGAWLKRCLDCPIKSGNDM